MWKLVLPLNVLLFQIVALILIIVPSVAKSAAYVSSLYIVGGIIACGIFLLFVAVVGLVGAAKHHQVCLFFVSFCCNGTFLDVNSFRE